MTIILGRLEDVPLSLDPVLAYTWAPGQEPVKPLSISDQATLSRSQPERGSLGLHWRSAMKVPKTSKSFGRASSTDEPSHLQPGRIARQADLYQQ